MFLTEEPYTWWADLVWWISRVAPGRVVLLAAGRRASLGLRHARKFLTHHGSIFISSLGHDTSWSWGFVKGGRTLFESVVRGLHMGQVRTLASQADQYCLATDQYVSVTAGLIDAFLPELQPGVQQWQRVC